MFTGIIEEVGRIAHVEDLGGGKRFTIHAEMTPTLRVDVDADAETFDVVSIEETLRKTTFSALREDDPVNLERAMRADSRLDGHFVQGHVDATGTVISVEREDTDWLYRIRFDEQFAAYLIPVGSIAIDGISLTVARLEGNTLTVAIIPHTYDNTNVPTWTEGAAVNLEFDMIGKYVVRALAQGRDGVDPTALARQWLELAS